MPTSKKIITSKSMPSNGSNVSDRTSTFVLGRRAYNFSSHNPSNVNKNIDQINKQKQVARKYYYEKIIAIDTFDWDAIDSFLTNRYRFNSNK